MQSIVRSAYYSDSLEKMSSHYHDCHQILFVKSGKIQIEINGKAQIANSGDFILISRFESHSIKILSEVYERYIIRINPEVSDSNREFSMFTLRPQSFKNTIRSKEFSEDFINIFERIIKEAEVNDNLSGKMNELLLSELLIYIERLTPKAINENNDTHIEIVFNLKRRLEKEYNRDYDLTELAEQYHISVSSLCHSFKRITGFSVIDYLLFCRMANAKNLLAKTNLPISEIVELCGFSDNSNFSRTFKKISNISPRDFRIKYSKQ